MFIAMSFWGWWQWLQGRAELAQGAAVGSLSAAGRRLTWVSLLVLWPTIGLLLQHATDSDVPWLDALPTAGSLIGQYLLAKKRVENWPVWLLVNLVSTALFAYKQLWLTVLLYAVFAALSVAGWRAWIRLASGRERSA